MRPSYPLLLAVATLAAALAPPAAPLPANSEAFRKLRLESAEMLPDEHLASYAAGYDFGPLLRHTPAASVVGFIGPHYQRLQVKLLGATRSATAPGTYALRGKTRILGIVRAFAGTLTLEQVRYTTAPLRPADEAPDGAPFPKVKHEGLALARYELRENPAEAQTGVFRGVAVVRWFVDDQNQLRYDDLNQVSDSFANNEFVGTWTSYRTRQPLTANWGDFRIPDAGQFDIGAGEFVPDAKYRAYGWAGYLNLLGSDAAVQKAQRQREEAAWWK